jgi:hypothetical protein
LCQLAIAALLKNFGTDGLGSLLDFLHELSYTGTSGFVATSGGLPVEAHTVTLQGDNQLLSAASSLSGTLTLVSPMRIETSPAVSGRVPGATWIDLVFVPEPGAMLLLVTGAVGLLIVGRSQIRK